jgi:hypothetical protein
MSKLLARYRRVTLGKLNRLTFNLKEFVKIAAHSSAEIFIL